MSIHIEQQGRRFYFIGDTYHVKDALRSGGANWDNDRRLWWIGKKDLAESLLQKVNSSAVKPRKETTGDDLEVRGQAKYKDRTYLLVWEGPTRNGAAVKLAFRDGSKTFWASAGAVQVWRRYEKPMTVGKLKRLREEYKTHGGPAPGLRYVCEECGEWVTAGQGSCWETGVGH